MAPLPIAAMPRWRCRRYRAPGGAAGRSRPPSLPRAGVPGSGTAPRRPLAAACAGHVSARSRGIGTGGHRTRWALAVPPVGAAKVAVASGASCGRGRRGGPVVKTERDAAACSALGACLRVPLPASTRQLHRDEDHVVVSPR